jgi:hypothetical protein
VTAAIFHWPKYLSLDRAVYSDSFAVIARGAAGVVVCQSNNGVPSPCVVARRHQMLETQVIGGKLINRLTEGTIERSDSTAGKSILKFIKEAKAREKPKKKFG